MSLADAMLIEDTIQKLIEENRIRDDFYIKVVNGQVIVYEKLEEVLDSEEDKSGRGHY